VEIPARQGGYTRDSDEMVTGGAMRRLLTLGIAGCLGAALAGDMAFLDRTNEGWRVSAAGCKPRGQTPADCELED
jgi:hypothetical protein